MSKFFYFELSWPTFRSVCPEWWLKMEPDLLSFLTLINKVQSHSGVGLMGLCFHPFFSEDYCHPTLNLYSFTNNGCSLRLLEKTWLQLFLWVINLSSCVICLVIAREIFLLQSDCSAMTKVHNFSLLSLLYN